jgi:hypothetical protein
MRSIHETDIIDLGPVAATLILDAGPRILGYARHDGPQLFADLPGEAIERDDGSPFEFIGGHRLWRGPEVPAVTYQPDDRPVAIERNHGVRITGPPDGDAVAKAITLSQHGAITFVDHTLTNEGWAPVRCAPWAITQLRPGGTAILPQPLEPVDQDGVLPNRSLVLWPYTDPAAPELEIQQQAVRVHATGSPDRTKIGQPNRRGWIGYVLDDEAFIKWSPLHDDDATYLDLGASVQCYRDHRFIELESLGPVLDLEPGASVALREAWTLIRLGGRPVDEVLASLPDKESAT